MTYTVRQLKQAAYNAGFRGPNLVIAVAVSLAENQARDEKATHRNPNGTTDYGAWQINSVHNLPGNPFDLQTNANMAYTVYRMQGWRAWTVFKSGAYKTKMVRAQRAKITKNVTDPSLGGLVSTTSTGAGGHAATGTDGDSGGGFDFTDTAQDVFGAVVPVGGLLTNNITDTTSFLRQLGDPAMWRRIGLGFLAFLIVLIGVIVMLSSNKNVRSLEKVAAVL